jgi:hypothetical protein
VLLILNVTERHRFGASSLHQRDPRSALFENYHASPPPSSSRTGYYGYNNPPQAAAGGLGVPQGHGGYRPATPNSRYVSFLYWGEKGKEGPGGGMVAGLTRISDPRGGRRLPASILGRTGGVLRPGATSITRVKAAMKENSEL